MLYNVSVSPRISTNSRFDKKFSDSDDEDEEESSVSTGHVTVDVA